MTHFPASKASGPQFKHDCDECLFLGCFREYDLYFCNQNGFGPTVIARFSSSGPDYTSGIGFSHPALQEAQIRALEMMASQ